MLQDMLYDWSLLHIYLKQHHLSVVSVSIGYFHCPIYVTEMRKKNLILQKKIFPIFISIKYLWKICYTRQIAKKICILYYLVFCMLTSAKMRYELKYEALPSKWASQKPSYKKSGWYLRNKSWKPECVLSFNMGWWMLVFHPQPEARDKIY